jgi:maltose/moltooligosaccharide transporter
MISEDIEPPPPPPLARPKELYTAGSLVYTRAGLVALFGWLLWGDFILTLMERVMPSLLPVLLKSHGASNSEVAFIVSTLALVANSVLNPVISYQSDRFRSRWGRRRPFILLTTPFVVLFLAAIPFAPELTALALGFAPLQKLLSLGWWGPGIVMFGLLVAAFQIFNMFISSVYYYLIPDVVPHELLGRFFGLFRIFGTLAGILFNYFVFGLAETHMKEIFVVTALVYGLSIMLMCLNVREGEYPPPITEEHGRWSSGIRNYARECFGHSYYWWAFLAYSALGWGTASNALVVFFYRDELGFSLDFFGKVMAAAGVAFTLLCYPFGILIDRWGCHKTLMLASASTAFFSLGMFFFANDVATGVAWTIFREVSIALGSMALAKWTVEVYPMDRYGQFGSAGAMFSSIGGVLTLSVFAWLLDGLRHYRYALLWQMLFALVSLFAAAVVFKKWKSLGGPGNYQAP